MSNPWRFKTTLREQNVHVVSDEFLDASGSFEVDWSLELEVRSWGVKELFPIVHRVSGMLTSVDEDSPPTEFASTGDDFLISTDFALSPTEITINLKDKTILIGGTHA